MKKLLFITTSSLASNPRLIKEIESLNKFYECHIVYYYHNDWSYELSKNIENNLLNTLYFPIDRRFTTISRIFYKLIHLLAIKLNVALQNTFTIQALSLNDKSLELLCKSNKLAKKNNYQRIIAHNIGAFYPAFECSKKNKIYLQADIEDYHPGEKTYFNHTYEIANRKTVMQAIFNKAYSVTYASKGIFLQCKENFRLPDSLKNEVIINSFLSTDFELAKSFDNEKINCVWYSQHISHGRGLEMVFEAARQLPHINFHIVGNKDKNYLSSVSLSENIIFHSPMSQKNLHHFICKMDIGLALEDIKSDENRNICLTNKILSYAQAGIYIFATDTFGQKDFLESLPYKAGEIINTDLVNLLSNFNQQVLLDKKSRILSARFLCWENESNKLIKLVENA